MTKCNTPLCNENVLVANTICHKCAAQALMVEKAQTYVAGNMEKLFDDFNRRPRESMRGER